MSSDSHSEPSLRERLREATRQAILVAAEATFAERGIHAARMEDVASRAGVAVGTLYNYFGDKKQVVRALVDGHRESLLGRLDAALALRPAFAEALTAWLDAMLAHIEAHRAFFAVFLAEDTDRERAESRHSMVEEIRARAAKLVRAGLEQKMLRPEHAELYPVLLVALVRSVGASVLGKRGRDPVVPDAAGLADVFLHGTAAHEAPKDEEKGRSCKPSRRA